MGGNKRGVKTPPPVPESLFKKAIPIADGRWGFYAEFVRLSSYDIFSK